MFFIDFWSHISLVVFSVYETKCNSKQIYHQQLQKKNQKHHLARIKLNCTFSQSHYSKRHKEAVLLVGFLRKMFTESDDRVFKLSYARLVRW